MVVKAEIREKRIADSIKNMKDYYIDFNNFVFENPNYKIDYEKEYDTIRRLARQIYYARIL